LIPPLPTQAQRPQVTHFRQNLTESAQKTISQYQEPAQPFSISSRHWSYLPNNQLKVLHSHIIIVQQNHRQPNPIFIIQTRFQQSKWEASYSNGMSASITSLQMPLRALENGAPSCQHRDCKTIYFIWPLSSFAHVATAMRQPHSLK